MPRDSPKIELWSQQEKSTKCSKFISFKPSKISKFRHFYQLYNNSLLVVFLGFLNYSISEFSWLWNRILHLLKYLEKLKFLNFDSKIRQFSLPFSLFLCHVLTALEKLSWDQCRKKVDKSQLYIPHQRPVEHWEFFTLTTLTKKHFRI